MTRRNARSPVAERLSAGSRADVVAARGLSRTLRVRLPLGQTDPFDGRLWWVRRCCIHFWRPSSGRDHVTLVQGALVVGAAVLHPLLATVERMRPAFNGRLWLVRVCCIHFWRPSSGRDHVTLAQRALVVGAEALHSLLATVEWMRPALGGRLWWVQERCIHS